MRNFTKQTILAAIMLLVLANVGWGQIIAWQFGSPASLGSEVTYNATTNNPNLNTSVLSRGSGISATALGRGFAANNWDISATKATAITNNEYFQFTINSKSGYNVSLSTLDARLRRSGTTAPNAYIWKYSIDGSTFTEIGSDISFTSTADGVDQTQINLTGISALQNVESTTTITFRLYAWGGTSTTATFSIARYAAGNTSNCLAIGGTVTPTGGYSTPTTQASNITFSSVTATGLTSSWTKGDGTKRLVIMNTTNSFTNPTDGQTDPSANTVYSGSGEQVVYNNTSNSVSVTGLSQNTTYYFRVYEYNGSGTSSKYLTSTGTNNPNSQTTPFAVPTTQASSITFSDVQEKQMTISWTSGNGTNRAVFIKETAGPITNPSNGTTYSASTDWSLKGTQLGTSGYYCVYNNNGNSVTVTNLSSGTLYVVQVFEYNGSSSSSVYYTATATGNPNS